MTEIGTKAMAHTLAGQCAMGHNPWLPQALILNNIIKYGEHYFTYLPEFFSPFIHNTQI